MRNDGWNWWTRRDAAFALFNRYGGRCCICGRVVALDKPMQAPDRATIDHIIPLSKGGTSDPENLQLACFPCNDVKRDWYPG